MPSSPFYNSSTTRFWHEREWWIALGLCTLILSVNLLRPLHYDNAVYQSITEQWLRYGRKFLIGTLDQNFPGILYFHAISYYLFGTSEIGFRFFESILHLAQAVGMYLLVRRSHSSHAALATSVLSCELYLSGSDWSVGQRDAFVMLCLVFATLIYYRLKDRPQTPIAERVIFILVTGMLMGLVILLRPTYGLITVWFGLVWIMTSQRSRVRTFVFYSAGVVLTFLLALAPYLHEPQIFNQLYLAVFRLNLDAYGTAKYGRLPWAWGVWKAWLFIIGVLFVSLWAKRKQKSVDQEQPSDRSEMLLFAGFYVASLISIISMGKYFRTHLEPLYQLSAILLAITVIGYFDRGEKKRVAACVALLAVGLLFFTPWKLPKFFYEALASGASHPLQYVYEHTYPDSLHGYAKQTELATYIRQRTFASDRVEFAVADPWLSYRTGRQLTSRFPSIVHLVITPPVGNYKPYQREWQQEFLDSIAIVRPKFFVTAFGPDPKENEFLPDVPYKALMRIPGYNELIAKDYQLDTTIGWWMVYRLKQPSP